MKNKQIFQNILIVSTIALFLFGIMGQVLCEKMGYTPCLQYYLVHLLLVVGAGLLVYGATRLFIRDHKVCRIPAVFMGSIILIWTIFIGYFYVAYQMDEDSRQVYYGNGSYLAITEQSEEIRHMISKSQFGGHGDPYYAYPDGMVGEGDAVENAEEIQAAVEERDRAEEAFWHFRGEVILPVLSYTYGLWINVLYSCIALAWCVGAVGSLALVHGWGQKLLYGVCTAVLCIQLGSVVLGSFGLIAALIPPPFSLEWEADLMSVTPQLGIMFGLLCSRKVKVDTPTDRIYQRIMKRRENYVVHG